MPALVPYVAAYSNELGPRELDLCIEVPRSGVPHIAYTEPRPDDRDAHGNLWARMTRPPESERGRVMYDCMDPLRQRECMEGLLCQVCAQPAETSKGTVFVEWDRPGGQPKRLDLITTDAPPVCRTCLPLSLRRCPFLRDEESVRVLLVRKSVISGVSGTLYRVSDDLARWIPSEQDAYSSFTKTRHPGMLAQRLHRKLRGVTVLGSDELPPVLVPTPRRSSKTKAPRGTD
ncbi:hypothetical protein [Streptomyces acidicola]|uniref:hypothetical protein n=1 Tax=Streptomyces acidicola TaxID=2596892 RepID=UPI0037F15831